MKVSVIIPSTGRARQLVECIKQLLKVSPDVEVICVIEHDLESKMYLEGNNLPIKTIYRNEHRGPVYGWNEGAAIATGDALVLAADDCWFHEGWLKAALEALESIGGSGVVGLENGTGRPKRHFTEHYMVTRDYAVEAWGGVLCVPHYKHVCVDVEACMHATEDNKYVYAVKAVVEHRHPAYKKAEKDATYRLQMYTSNQDHALYDERKLLHWPIDYEPVFGERIANET